MSRASVREASVRRGCCNRCYLVDTWKVAQQMGGGVVVVRPRERGVQSLPPPPEEYAELEGGFDIYIFRAPEGPIWTAWFGELPAVCPAVCPAGRIHHQDVL